MAKRLYLVAGEASGDTHGAALLTALRRLQPAVSFIGRGGPKMKAIAGDSFTNWIESAAVVGLWEVLKHYGYFRQQFREAIEQIRSQQPDAVVLIDYPGFNLRLAHTLRARSPRLKIIYYISPQVWAWNRRRIPQMARDLDLMLCIFPFEAELYNQTGLRTIFVGHPMMENPSARRVSDARDPDLVGLFPGSRPRELRKILPIILEAAREIMKSRPGTRFEIAAASPKLAQEAERMLKRTGPAATAASVSSGQATILMQRAQAGIVASGTATLEAAYFRLPFVLVYRMAWLTYFIALWMVKVKYVGMPNVLAGRLIIPEFIQHRAKPRAIADSVLRLLHDENARNLVASELDAVVSSLGEKEASMTAAGAILEEIG